MGTSLPQLPDTIYFHGLPLGNLVGIIELLLIICGIPWTIYSQWSKIKRLLVWMELKFIPTKKFNVAIYFESEQQGLSFQLNEELKARILNSVQLLNLQNIIKIRDFKDICIFSNREEAQAYRKSKGLDLIIWGRFTRNGITRANKDYVALDPIYFTFPAPSDPDQKIVKWILNEFDHIARSRYTLHVENGNSEDIDRLKNCIFELSVYLLALTFLLQNRTQESLILFELLFSLTEGENSIFREGVRTHLQEVYELLLATCYFNKDYSNGKIYCCKLLDMKQNHFQALVGLGYFEWFLGNVDASDVAVTRLLNVYPNEPITWVNVAFINLVKKRYPRSFSLYKKIEECKVEPNFQTLKVVEFLEDYYDSHPEEPGVLYASGIINYRFGDLSRANILLQKFIQLAPKDTYKKMLSHAEKIVSQLYIK